jgi:tRNA A-37 threonylcarbamoyl transferase component Bud32
MSDLKTLTLDDLRKKAEKYGIKAKDMTKRELISFIQKEDSQKKKNLDKYQIKEQLGLKGKDGKTFLVVDKFGYEYAMKQFRKNKSVDGMLKEVQFQRRCSEVNLSPKIIDVDTKNKFIVMEKMDYHLLDEINANGGLLTDKRQKELVTLLKEMDRIGVFQGDANLLNYMVKNDRLFVIDFGMAKENDTKLQKTTGTKTPNLKLMLLAFVIKLKESNAREESFSYLKKFLSEEDMRNLGM